jgi:hypothetical protein
VFDCEVEGNTAHTYHKTLGLLRLCLPYSFPGGVADGRTVAEWGVLTGYSPDSVQEVVDGLKRSWKGVDYEVRAPLETHACAVAEFRRVALQLMRKNCCHFCNELLQALAMKELPHWITGLASAGAGIADFF